MSNLNYSNYDNFVKVIQDLLPCLPKILQNQFNQEIGNKTYGTPATPKDGLLLKYAMKESDGEQIISPLSILIECTSNLYKAMHSLSPFTSGIKISRGM
ncbi:hypothetical protein NDA18_000436 [Ustilago nuda]|nr:hypothetical protein NDA18_000436 [Ustilago nuda]